MKSSHKNCSKCQVDKKISDFYRSFSPLDSDGILRVCKTCLKSMVNPNSLDSIKDVLRMLDKPFVMRLWKTAETKNDEFGEYFKLINAKDYRDLNWNDSVFDKLENETEILEESNHDTTTEFVNESKRYSKKWMGYYSEIDLDYLENYMSGLNKDFKIATENHKDYAKKIAKASLHMDVCFRDMMDGISGAERKYKDSKDVFDTLSKSAQFSESQRGQNEVGLGCFGRVFELVESKTYIPEHIPIEPDDLDKMLNDFSHILKSI